MGGLPFAISRSTVRWLTRAVPKRQPMAGAHQVAVFQEGQCALLFVRESLQ
jgi:hypothetical protein